MRHYKCSQKVKSKPLIQDAGKVNEKFTGRQFWHHVLLILRTLRWEISNLSRWHMPSSPRSGTLWTNTPQRDRWLLIQQSLMIYKLNIYEGQSQDEVSIIPRINYFRREMLIFPLKRENTDATHFHENYHSSRACHPFREHKEKWEA